MDCKELDALPKALLAQLSAKELGPYCAKLRGQRNTYRNQEAQARKALEKCKVDLAAARRACREMKERIATLESDCSHNLNEWGKERYVLMEQRDAALSANKHSAP